MPDSPQTVRLTINGRELEVPPGTTILEAARSAGIRIPTLCHHPDLCVAGVCRICVVEVSGRRTLQAACACPVTAPIQVRTHTRKVRQARRHIVELLLSDHDGACVTCGRESSCELLALAREFGVDGFRFGHPDRPRPEPDRSSPSIIRDEGKCVLCRRCVRTCLDLQKVGAVGVLGRGTRSRIGTFQDLPLGSVVCIDCGQCVNRCPTGALRAVDPTGAVWAAIQDPGKHVVIQTAPSPRAAIGECFGLPPGRPLTFELNTALRRCGFDRVFDTTFGADLTVVEESAELLLRLRDALAGGKPPLPQFTSCCPAWVKYLEHFYPEFLPNLSSAKSPQQMFGAVLKTRYARQHGLAPEDIVSVALMPCTAKKAECGRPGMDASGYRDVDYALTTRELARMITQAGLDLAGLPGSEFDPPFGTASGSGVIFGASGGVMEAALRTVFEWVGGIPVEDRFRHADIEPLRGFEGVRRMELTLPVAGPVPALLAPLFTHWVGLAGATLRVAVAHGNANAMRVMEDIRRGGPFSRYHFIEFMACPGGCVGGGGQPIPTNAAIREARTRAIFAEDAAYPVRKAHENPDVLRLYRDFLTGGPCGPLSRKLLHGCR
jgi:NADH-quinone oxidoreductase subunit G/[NiFe] hydrogenase diaphorase moiety small subunit